MMNILVLTQVEAQVETNRRATETFLLFPTPTRISVPAPSARTGSVVYDYTISEKDCFFVRSLFDDGTLADAFYGHRPQWRPSQ